MVVPCVRVPRAEGESTRRHLADLGIIDAEHAIAVEQGWLYIPVVDADGVPAEYDVVRRDAPDRETPTVPTDLLEFAPTYERLGDIVLLAEDDHERARRAATAVMESDVPAKTVVNRASAVKGDRRVRDWVVLAGNGTETVHREYGCEYLLDVTEVYFSPRLATERHRVAEQVVPEEQTFDMFAGVGPFVIPFAKRGADCIGTDINAAAIEYLRENARRNGVSDRTTAIHGDITDIAPQYAGWADRIVMNLPHSADQHLDEALTLAGEDCMLHYYDIQHEDDPYSPGETAIRAAAESSYEVDVQIRREVRSYAPHELNVCLDVRLRRS